MNHCAWRFMLFVEIRNGQLNTIQITYFLQASLALALSAPRDRMMDQESSLTLTVGLILVVYLVCNVPANLILLLDPGSVAIRQ